LEQNWIIIVAGFCVTLLAAWIGTGVTRRSLMDRSHDATLARLRKSLKDKNYKHRKYTTLKRDAPWLSDTELRHLLNTIADPVMIRDQEMWRIRK
jgi:hypothetical protein